jgi:thiamine pyrophosphokinase
VIVGSAPVAATHLRRLAEAGSLLICADGGADVALRAGLRPDLVVGDMDSISAAARSRLVGEGVQCIQHPTAKDQTDLELAIDLALERRPARISITGALGGMRFDHTAGNLLLLALPAFRGVDVRIDEGVTEALVIWDRGSIAGRPGEYVSLLPLSPRVEGVRSTGLLYPLGGESLLQGHTRGVSNELEADRAVVTVESGCLLLIHERSARTEGE